MGSSYRVAMFLVHRDASPRLHLISSDALDEEDIFVAIDANQATMNVFLVARMANVSACNYTTTAVCHDM